MRKFMNTVPPKHAKRENIYTKSQEKQLFVSNTWISCIVHAGLFNFEMTLGRLGGPMSRFWNDFGVPWANFGLTRGCQEGPTSAPDWHHRAPRGADRGAPVPTPEAPKPSNTNVTIRVSRTLKKKLFFVSNTWTCWKLSCGGGNIALFTICDI